MRLVLMKGLANPIVQLMTAIGVSPVVAYAIAESVHGRMSSGALFGFLTALGMLAQHGAIVVGAAYRAPLRYALPGDHYS